MEMKRKTLAAIDHLSAKGHFFVNRHFFEMLRKWAKKEKTSGRPTQILSKLIFKFFNGLSFSDARKYLVCVVFSTT
jgi:hypothetical protein